MLGLFKFEGGELEMSPRHEKFCLEYAKSGNATEAYKLAGYQCQSDGATRASASQLLSNPNIQKRLQELAAEVKNASIANVAEIQEILSGMLRNKREKGAVRVQAAQTLLKVQGAFSNQGNLTTPAPVVLVDDVHE